MVTTRRPPCPRSWIAGIVICFLAVLRPGAAAAHEIGSTQIVASFEAGGAFHLEISVDPDALLTRLQLLVNGDVVAPASRADRDLRLEDLLPAFANALRVRIDGHDAETTLRYLPASAFGDLAQAPSTIRVDGRAPAGAGVATIAYGLSSGTFALVVRVRDSPPQTLWIDGDRDSAPIALAAAPPPEGTAAIVARYFALGFTHILPGGVDHILFVLGLFLLSARRRPVLLQVSAFTLAHSLTFALTLCGIVSLPARVVEPMIALSIAYVACENVMTTELKTWRIALVFAFGLLHGMGFAGVLRDIGLPKAQLVPALFSFNAGVEAGQLVVVAGALAAVACWRSDAATYRRLVVQPASVLLAATGLFWTVQRLL